MAGELCNNHHAQPQSARHGVAWFKFDLNWYGISALRTLGLEQNVKAQKLDSHGNRKAEIPQELAA
jgi:stearoyl-CoA desaturase (delta-9 desaturase)